MFFEPQLNWGRSQQVRIPNGSSFKDLRQGNADLREFRSSMSERARNLGPWELPPQDFLKLIKETQPLRVGIFLSRDDWAEPSNLINLCEQLPKDIQILGPTLSHQNLSFQVYRAEDVEKGPHSIWHLRPNGKTHTPDLLLVPALACDVHGARLGRGKGYYDRYLAQAEANNASLRACAVLHSTFIFTSLPDQYFHAGDRKVHFVLSEQNLTRCTVNSSANSEGGNEVQS
jgi:5-formyltetrahydrofolate cyclo-ligase